MAGIYNIPSGVSFLDSLAQGLLRQTQDEPLELCHYTLFLPTRHACTELQNAFLRQSEGQPLLLPKMLPLGDLDQEEELILNTPLPSLPPVLPTFKRQGLLTKLILHYTQQHDGLVTPHSAASATQLAQELMKLIDDAQVEDISWDNLVDLVPQSLASHWQITLDFLKIVSDHWPQILASTHHVEPHTYNALAVERLIQRWQDYPPTTPILAAGSTGTRSTTALLLSTISKLKQGSVILPGLQAQTQDLPPTHPHFAHHEFLKKLGVDPSEVAEWPFLAKEAHQNARSDLFLNALFPNDQFSESTATALENLDLVELNTPQQEALTIALLIRQALETPAQTIALVTPDQKLVERVSGELERWNITINQGNRPLSQTSQGLFLRLLLKAVAEKYEAHALLAFLKHPLCRIPNSNEDWIETLETSVLRGPVLKPGRVPLLQAAKAEESVHDSLTTFSEITSALVILLESDSVEIQSLLETLLKCAECLTESPSPLWQGYEGESLSQFFGDLFESAADFPAINGSDFLDFFEVLMGGYLSGSNRDGHPRISILKPFQARLHHADLMILSSLNEGVWPKESSPDPWLNRQMREQLGFSPAEQLIGLSAHDFYQAFCNPKVILTRSQREGGTPTVPSRWLLCLDILLKKTGQSLSQVPDLLSLQKALDQPETLQKPQRPAPCPPLSARPRQASVTQIETWMRDPYAFYARHILDLKPLEAIAQTPDAADRGTLLHKAFEDFLNLEISPHQPDAYNQLLSIGEKLFSPLNNHVDVAFFWWPRFEYVARWFLEEQKQRPSSQSWTEVRGSLTFQTPEGPFTLRAQADRIDQDEQGRVILIDYKTGQLPTLRDIQKGFSPQLPLEAAILLEKGFKDVPSNLSTIEFWGLQGGKTGGVIRPIKTPVRDIASQSLQGLKDLVSYYDQPATRYPAMPWPNKALAYNDYTHLARVQEWRNR